MSEILNALPPWLAIQFIAVAAVTYAVVMAMRRGERDRKNGYGHNGDGATPRWFSNEQTLELLRDIKELLHDLKKLQHDQISLLENISNENVINPRRLQE